MDLIAARIQQLEVLAESIVAALKEEKELLLVAQQQLELVHPPTHWVGRWEGISQYSNLSSLPS